jgi:hypothetical protein
MTPLMPRPSMMEHGSEVVHELAHDRETVRVECVFDRCGL